MNKQSYVTSQTLSNLEIQLGIRDRNVLQLINRFGLLSGQQIRRLCYSGEGTGRTDGQVARRALLRLTRLGVLTRLARRIGGIRAGSEAFVYRLGPSGQRLIRYWSAASGRGRNAPEPGERFVAHRLAVSEIYVRLIEAVRANTGLELLSFEAEPDSWRPFLSGGLQQTLLKPDAFLRLAAGDNELWWFIEVDRGTVSRRTRVDQAEAYRAYFRSGAAGEVMPRVLWLVSGPITAEQVRDALRPDDEPHGLFVVETYENAVAAATAIT